MKKATISRITGLEILDSRGNPTVCAHVYLSNGIVAQAMVPSGASTGQHEAHELRDGADRYGGKGVRQAIRHIERIIAPALISASVYDLPAHDQTMCALDGTPHKSKLGANAILGVSMALARAGAQAAGQPLYAYLRSLYALSHQGWRLPRPTMNVINGGAHANWSLDVQEYMIVPQQKKFAEQVRCGAEVFHALGSLLKKSGYLTLKGDEGGYAPQLASNEEPFKVLKKAITQAGYRLGDDVAFAIDVAATEFYNSDRQLYAMHVDGTTLSSRQLITMLKRWVKKYPFVSIEDALAEDDWSSWQTLTTALGSDTLLVGDDLFVTNSKRLQQGIELGVGNAILIKCNQIGTVSETIDTINLAQKHGYAISVSHRSGETSDTFIADLAVAVRADFIKTGSLSRSERVAKYNRLLEIEQVINS